jgi:hypothetical protein
VARLEPAVIAGVERFSGSELQHGWSPVSSAKTARFGDSYGGKTPARLVSGIRTGRSIW